MEQKLKQQRSLIHGLPDDLVADEILPRASQRSWWDERSVRAVSIGWRGAVDDHSYDPINKQMLAAVHRVQDEDYDRSSPHRLAVSVYDPERCSWTQMPPIPGVPCGAPLSSRCVCVDGRLYVIGGRTLPSLDFLRSVYCLDLRAFRPTWTRLADMAKARSAFACMTWKGNIVVAGGQCSGSELATAHVEMYDPHGDEWLPLPPLRLPRAECSGAVTAASDSLCVVGGFTCDVRGDRDPRLAQATWLDSIELLAISDSATWRHVTAAGAVRDVLRSCFVASSTLQRVHSSLFGKFLRRCDGSRWTSVAGRISASIGSGSDGDSGVSSDEEEEDDGVLMLLAVGGGNGNDEYSVRCSMDSRSGTVKASVCRKARNGMKNRAGHEVSLPFDLVPTVSCCLVCL